MGRLVHGGYGLRLLALLGTLWRPAVDPGTRLRQRVCAVGLAFLLVALRQQFREWG